MSLPVKKVALPRILDGQSNGRLPSSILWDTPGQDGGPTVRLVEPAARAWRALCHAARKEGHVLKASSALDSFRPYSDQERIFRQRYSLTPISGRPTKTWKGRRYWLRPNYATAAVPGASNHGFGLAVDTGEERDGDAGTESLDDQTLKWLLANADRFGWSWEVQSEPWHLRYYTGDHIPSAVLLYEAEQADGDKDQEENDEMLAGYDKDSTDVARATVRELCDRHWGYGKMEVKDQNWLVGEWQKNGREHMMTELLDHDKAKKD